MTKPRESCGPVAAAETVPVVRTAGRHSPHTTGQLTALDVEGPMPAVGSAHAARRYRQALRRLAGRQDRPLAVSLRLPFCASHCLFCDQPVHSGATDEQIDAHVDDLVREVHLLSATLRERHDVLQLHLGGGNASELGHGQLARLMEALHQAWRLPAEAELSIDCDPRRTHWGQLRWLRSMGFGQVNFGVMDLDAGVQRAIGRLQSARLLADACDQARASGMRCIMLKLMVGLPHQTPNRWQHTLSQVLQMAPDRLTFLRYRHRPQQVPAQQLIDADALPGAEQCHALMALAVDTLCSAGYRWVGADTFALDSDSLVQALQAGQLGHGPLGCTARPDLPLLGLGAGALGQIAERRVANRADWRLWSADLHAGRLPLAWMQPAGRRAAQARAAVRHLVCGQALPQAVASPALAEAYARLAARADQGWVRVLHDRIEVTGLGRLRLPQLCAEFEAMADGRAPGPALAV